ARLPHRCPCAGGPGGRRADAHTRDRPDRGGRPDMTTTEIPAYTREDTQEKLTARQISRELARRDGHDGGYTPAVPGWVHPLWDGMPAVAADRGAQRMDYARSLVGYEHARHAAAQW